MLLLSYKLKYFINFFLGVVIKADFAKELVTYFKPQDLQNIVGPVNANLKRSEATLMPKGSNPYDLLFGVVTSEAFWRFSSNDIQAGFEGERRDKIIRTYVRNAYTYHLSEIFFTVVNEYTDWERTVQHPINTRDACVSALSDAQFVAPLVQTGDLLSAKPPQPGQEPSGPKTFFYVFDYQTKDGDYPQVSCIYPFNGAISSSAAYIFIENMNKIKYVL